MFQGYCTFFIHINSLRRRGGTLDKGRGQNRDHRGHIHSHRGQTFYRGGQNSHRGVRLATTVAVRNRPPMLPWHGPKSKQGHPLLTRDTLAPYSFIPLSNLRWICIAPVSYAFACLLLKLPIDYINPSPFLQSFRT